MGTEMGIARLFIDGEVRIEVLITYDVLNQIIDQTYTLRW